MNKQIICTALAALFGICTIAQNFGEIRGKVRDEKGEVLEGAIAIAENGAEKIGIATGEDGVFRLKPLGPGKYDLRITMLGMDTIIVKGVIVNPDKITMMKDFDMTVHVFDSPGATVEGYRDPLIYKDGDHIQTLRAEDLKNMSSANGGSIGTIVQNMSSDIKPSRDGGGMSVRGSREGGVLFFVDGVKVRNSDVAIPSSGISSVSVYTGGIPAKYGDTTGGVVIVETKSYLEEYYKKLNQ